ncbi:uncharacterized protein PHACADRAFT_253227 [Phanerochaete carnosa HHB-10118-sp]|uniref:Uncharacterized protein n=1 Tax=Phanerochaete carnosa (strain HHB-10118-sp) TaxID=650164 RepID=K5V7I1_PHACS|nr:uncharacterized protein PHACADRAFT_253227 [Phanerochaete carnosa HHB-10118-sp]EKM58731.1 hypothetical protein PHACADRAFT_253227 [Phanerochaete carnosa HHB-10118-sp]
MVLLSPHILQHLYALGWAAVSRANIQETLQIIAEGAPGGGAVRRATVRETCRPEPGEYCWHTRNVGWVCSRNRPDGLQRPFVSPFRLHEELFRHLARRIIVSAVNDMGGGRSSAQASEPGTPRLCFVYKSTFAGQLVRMREGSVGAVRVTMRRCK